jgi:hypothetical protein
MTIEAASLLVSSSALCLTCIFAIIGWRHQRLGALPHCHFVTVSSRSDNHKLGLYLRNNGPGVAIIVGWKFFDQGVFIGENLAGMVEAKRLLGEADIGRYWLEPGDSIQPNAVEKILWREKDQERSPGGLLLSAKDDLFKDRLELLNVELKVASIYKKKLLVTFDPSGLLKHK